MQVTVTRVLRAQKAEGIQSKCWVNMEEDKIVSIRDLARYNSKLYDIIIYYIFSGNTWIKYIIYQLHNLDKDDLGGKSLTDHIPLLEYAGTFSPDKPSDDPTRLASSHLNFDLLKDYVVEQNMKTIHVRRDPRDVIVSYYHFYLIIKSLGPFEGTWDEFYELFKKKELLYSDVIDHVNGWLNEAQRSNILYISYEEMKNDLKGVIGKVATFCSLEVTKEQIDHVAEKSTFKEMSANSTINGDRLVKIGMLDSEKGKFMRKGVVGDWKGYFTEEQGKHMEERLKEMSAI